MKKSVLLIHYYYPPIKSIACVRNYEMSLYWESWSDEIKLITTSNRNILQKDHLPIPNNISICESLTSDYRTRFTLMNKNGNHLSESTKKSFFGKQIVKALNSYPINIWFGEGGNKYINHAIELGSHFLNKNPQAIIYSSFRPFSDHYIASKLKEKFPQTTWIADFRDLHLDPLYKHYYFKSFQQRSVKRILKKADLITTVSDGLKLHLKYLADKIHVLQNGVKIRKSKVKNPCFTISYTGSLFLDERNPKPLFLALSNLLKENKISAGQLKVQYAGKDSVLFSQYIEEYNLQACYLDLGIISRKRALDLQLTSHVNLLLTASTKDYKGIMTGKFYEYLGSLTQILTIINGPNDDSFSIPFKKYALGYVYSTLDGNKEELESYIYTLYNDWNERKRSNQLDENIINSHFSWDSNFNDLKKQLEL